jgi:DNA-binding LacI/PurR family transcriptional regulator
MAKKRKESTIKDVAVKAGCSIGSVSRVLNGFDVSSDLKRKIEEAVSALGYIPPTNSATPRKRTGDVLILIHDKISDSASWTQMVLFQLMRVLGNFGYRAIVEFRSSDDNTPSEAMKMVDACIIWGSFPESLYDFFARQSGGIPIVSYSFDVPYENSICILPDKEADLAHAVLRLIGMGHKKLGLVLYNCDPINNPYSKSFFKTLPEYGCEPRMEWIRTQDDTEPSPQGYAPTMRLLDLEELPTAVIYVGDLLAYAGMEAIKSKGLKVPDDISVMGFDDLPLSAVTFPPLSAMRLDTMGLAVLLVESMEKLLLGREHRKKVFIKRDFVQRGSIALKRETGK